jgi:hypothetical protein
MTCSTTFDKSVIALKFLSLVQIAIILDASLLSNIRKPAKICMNGIETMQKQKTTISFKENKTVNLSSRILIDEPAKTVNNDNYA